MLDRLGKDYITEPVSIRSFISDPFYVGEWVVDNLFDPWKDEIVAVIEGGILEWVLSGAIGVGKTTSAMVAQLYKLYCVTCMRNPCQFYTANSITFGFYSAMRYLAYDVNATMLINRLRESPYFRDVVGVSEEEDDPKKTKVKVFNFPNNVRFIFGASQYHGMGQDVFSVIMDEVAFYEGTGALRARELYNGIRTRIASRFKSEKGLTPGLLALCSSANYEGDFLDEHIKSSELKDSMRVSRFATYEVKHYPGPRFRVLVGDRLASSRILDDVVKNPTTGQLEVHPIVGGAPIPEGAIIENVPIRWYPEYKNDLPQALKDVSGRAMSAEAVFFPSMEKVDLACNPSNPAVTVRPHPFKETSISLAVTGSDSKNTIEEFFDVEELFVVVDRFKKKYRLKTNPGRPRFLHIDLAESRCSAGFTCVHLAGFRSVMKEDLLGRMAETRWPVIYVDFTLEITPPRESSEIDFGKFLDFIFFLRNAGMPIGSVSYDQYQSHHSQQILEKSGINSVEVSLDRSPGPYNVLKDLYNVDCINAYPYAKLRKELFELRRKYVNNRMRVVKSDRKDASKDIADSLAGAVYNLWTSDYLQEARADGMIVAEGGKVVNQKDQALRRRRIVAPEIHGQDVDWVIRGTPGSEKITDIY